MSYFLIGGALIGASIGGGTAAARGAKGWDIGKSALMGGATGAVTGGAGGALAGGAGGGLFGGLLGGGEAAAGTGVTAMGSGLGGGALGSGAIGTGMTAAEMSGSALPGVTAGASSGGLMGGMTNMLTPQNLQTMNGLLGGGQQQRPLQLPPAPGVPAQNMGGMSSPQIDPNSLIVHSNPGSVSNPLEEWLRQMRGM